MFVTDLQHVELDQRRGIVHAVGEIGGTFTYRRSCNGGKTAAAIDQYGATSATITTGALDQPGLRALPNGVLVAAIPQLTTIEIWDSHDGGNHWRKVEVIPA